jgi:hypothetical protein
MKTVFTLSILFFTFSSISQNNFLPSDSSLTWTVITIAWVDSYWK